MAGKYPGGSLHHSLGLSAESKHHWQSRNTEVGADVSDLIYGFLQQCEWDGALSLNTPGIQPGDGEAALHSKPSDRQHALGYFAGELLTIGTQY